VLPAADVAQLNASRSVKPITNDDVLSLTGVTLLNVILAQSLITLLA